MNGFFQLLIAWGVLLVFVLMLYMIDKLNFVFSGFSQNELPETYTDGLFGELFGKPLWDAMSGLPIPGIEKKLVENLKPHYEPVLRQHIEQVFLEGYHHAREGTLGVPSNNRMIPTPRGALESWLPLHHLTSIYEAGSEFFSKPDADVMRIQQNLDQITSMLYARVGISLTDPYSRTLMVHPVGVVRPNANSLIPSPEVSALSAPVTSAPGFDAPAVTGVGTTSSAVAPTPTAIMQSSELNTEVESLGNTVSIGAAPPSVTTDAVGSGVASTHSISQDEALDNSLSPKAAGVEDDLLLQPNLSALNVEQASAVKA